MADENVIIFVTLNPKPGKEAELESLLRGMCTPSRAEKGCIVYNLFKKAKDGSSLHLFECWSTAAALDAHRETIHYKNFRAHIGDLVEGLPSPIFLRRLDSLA